MDLRGLIPVLEFNHFAYGSQFRIIKTCSRVNGNGNQKIIIFYSNLQSKIP